MCTLKTLHITKGGMIGRFRNRYKIGEKCRKASSFERTLHQEFLYLIFHNNAT